LLTTKISFSQQESKILIDSGKGNSITITQNDASNDSNKKSEIEIRKSDSNKINLQQNTKGQTNSGRLITWLKNIHISVKIIIGLLSAFLLFLTIKRNLKKK
jgi:hypothetical protein